MGDGSPVWSHWKQLADHQQYQYWNSYDPRNEADSVIKVTEQVKQMLAASMVLVEFKPFMSAAPVVATFDLRGLKSEFRKHVECNDALAAEPDPM
jgi:hypothetical protein